MFKILVIHNFHRKGSASGDDQVFKAETALLEQYGHKVIRYSVSNDDFDDIGISGKIRAALGMFWSFKNYKEVKRIILQEKQDVVHVHTFFPLLSPSVLYAAHHCGVKVVATLHDTRLICPCATSLCGTKLCNKCGDGHYMRMVWYKCFKGSRIQSFVVACIFKFHRICKTYYKYIDKYICLNDNQIELLKSVGFEESKLIKKYNFVPDSYRELREVTLFNLPERYIVYYGRMGVEKGVRVLMQIWNQISDIPLVVMGGGPLEQEFKEWADKKDNVYFLGYTEHQKCLSIVEKSQCVITPSICYEGCSMVVIETESLAKTLITTDLGFSKEAIVNGENGFKIALGDIEGFSDIVRQLWNNPEQCEKMGRAAREDYLRKYQPEDNCKQLIAIYQSLLA